MVMSLGPPPGGKGGVRLKASTSCPTLFIREAQAETPRQQDHHKLFIEAPVDGKRDSMQLHCLIAIT